MIKTKVTFLEGRLLSSQLEQFEKFSKSSDWLEKSRPSKKLLLFWSCKQAICLLFLTTSSVFECASSVVGRTSNPVRPHRTQRFNDYANSKTLCSGETPG